MVSFANRFNKTSFGIDTTNFKYVKLSEMYQSDGADVIHTFNGAFVHHGKLGDSPVLIDEDHKLLINLPSHMTETVREILADPDAVQYIKEKKVGFTIYEYESHARKCYSISFVDL